MTGTLYFIAPADDPRDQYAAGYDGNLFGDQAEAERIAESLSSDLGPDYDVPWVVTETTPEEQATHPLLRYFHL